MNLHQAAREGNLNALLQLINAGRNINSYSTGLWSYTPLHLATKEGHMEIALVLIARGANVNTTGPSGTTPLHEATYKGHTQIALALIEKGADVNATSDMGWTPLHQAVYNGHTQTVVALIAKGANINAADQYGYTPLSLAISRNEQATALAIIHYGKVPYAEIPVIENNPTSEYIQRQYQLTTTPLERTASYARGLFTGMHISPRDTIMARIKIFVKGTGAKGTYPLLMKLLYIKKPEESPIQIPRKKPEASLIQIPIELINVILEYAGLLPQNMNLKELMIYPRPSSRLLSAEATTCNATHASATSFNTPRPL